MGKCISVGLKALLILYFYGSGESVSDYDSVVSYCARRGLTLFAVDCLGYGLSNGALAATALREDAIAIYNYNQADYLLTQHGFSYPDSFVRGCSLGSVTTIEVSYRAGIDVASLIIESGFASYTLALLLCLSATPLSTADEARDGFGNLKKIGQIMASCPFIHG